MALALRFFDAFIAIPLSCQRKAILSFRNFSLALGLVVLNTAEKMRRQMHVKRQSGPNV